MKPVRVPFAPVVAAMALWLCACGHGDRPGAQARVAPPAPAAAAPSDTAYEAPLVPATATLNDVGRVLRNPDRGSLPADSVLAGRIRLGFRIFRETPRYAPRYVGNGLACGNCHLNAGQRDRALPLVGVAAAFPEYRSRAGRLITLEDRIRSCFLRSENGTAPDYASDELLALSAYIAWLAEGQPMGQSPAWRGKNVIAKGALVPVAKLDRNAGKQVYVRVCAACHGIDGQGVDLGVARPGPLWGPRSWNDGAGMARVYTAAGFIRYAMPLTAPGSLTDREAQEVALYIDTQPRPAFAGKARDWPRGDVPPDAVYYPRRPRRAPPPPPAADSARPQPRPAPTDSAARDSGAPLRPTPPG